MPKHLETLPLHSERNEIRLLTLLPCTKAESIIKCSLKTVSLDDKPKFQAISYVWGDTSKKTDIIINDTLFYVTPSVDKTLRLLRHRNRRRVVWIDFVCINQHDVFEKNTQVPLLGRVYASASAVVAMMATDDKDTRAAISWMNAFEHSLIAWQAIEWRILRYMSQYWHKARDVGDSRLATLKDQLLVIKDDPYWTRMWTYQEYQLAKSYPTCMSGKLTFNADLLLELADYPLPAHFINRGFKKFLSKRYIKKIRGLRDVGEPTQRLGYEPVLYHFRQTSHRQCKDPRDRVYALYSLLPSLQAQYPPDYNKPVGQVMHETTAYILHNAGLEVLGSFRLQGDHLLSCFPYPSWVLDLTSPTKHQLNVAHQTNLTRAYDWWLSCGSLLPTISDDLSTMTFRARCINVCSPVLQLGSTIPEVMKQLLDVADIHNESWGDSESRRISLLHACLDFSYLQRDFQRAPWTKARELFDLLQKIADQGTSSINSRAWDKIIDVLRANAGKTVLDIDDSIVKGFAISGPDVRQGDVAVMDLGLPVPLILRPYHEIGELYYRLVDIAYIPLLSNSALREREFDDVRFAERPLQVLSVR